MRHLHAFWALAALQVEASHASSSSPPPIHPTREAAYQHGFAIFNSVHNAMRQWGSSLHHNGMSLFLAHVPPNVLLHHGNSSPDTPLGRPEWVAFEIEHAESFTHNRPPRNGGDIPGGWLHTYRTTKPMSFLYVDGMGAGKTRMGTLDTQDLILRNLTMSTSTHPGDKQQQGNLELRRRGQPMPHGNKPDAPPRRSGPFDEVHRAAELCTFCKEMGLSGIIRMEAGFEIIKCDFSEGFELVQALQRPVYRFERPDNTLHQQGHPSAGHGAPDRTGGDPKRPPGSPPGLHGPHSDLFGSLEYLRGMSERYHSIGGGRVTVDFSSMTSAFFFPVNLTNPDPTRPDLPRLVNTTDTERRAIKSYLTEVIAKRHRPDSLFRPSSTDWQGISDMIVGRYADRVRFMAEEVDDVELMQYELEYLLTLFIDYSSSQPGTTSRHEADGSDMEAAIKRCTNFYILNDTAWFASVVSPPTEADEMIRVAFVRVSGAICTTLFNMHKVINATKTSSSTTNAAAAEADKIIIARGDRAATTQHIQQRTQARRKALARTKALAGELMTTLGWARFKQCNPACGLGEVCVVPMWPMGTVDEYERPSCANSSGYGFDGEGESYWR